MSSQEPGEYVITAVPASKLDARGVWYVAVCSCGAYRSGLHAYPGRAKAAGREHATAKTAAR